MALCSLTVVLACASVYDEDTDTHLLRKHCEASILLLDLCLPRQIRQNVVSLQCFPLIRVGSSRKSLTIFQGMVSDLLHP